MPRADRTDCLDREEPFSGRRTAGCLYLYVLEAPGVHLLKFGRSENPVRRYQQILDGSPTEIKMLGYCEDHNADRTAAWINAYLQGHLAQPGWFRDHPDCRMIAGLIAENRRDDLVGLAIARGSSEVEQQTHNLPVAGSTPAPATKGVRQ